MMFQPSLGRPRSSGLVELWTHRTLFGIFVLLWCLVLLQQTPALSFLPKANWIEPTLLVAALLITVSSLARQIPLQNALMAAGVIAVTGGAAHWVSHVASLPFGPIRFPHAQGNTPLQEWFCVPAVLWVVALLNARGVAKLILERQIKHRNRGLRVIGLSALLVVFMALALEPFASTVHRYWLWGETRLPVTWEGVPLSALFAWGVVSVIGLIAATPTLIDKHPRPAPPPTDPLWIWAMMGGVFGLGTEAAGLWAPTGVAIANVLLALAVAVLVKRRPTTHET